MERAPSRPSPAVVIAIEPSASETVSTIVAEAELELEARYGFLADSEAGVVAGMFEAPAGAFVVARSADDDRVLGGVGVRPCGSGIGEVKRLWVAPDARGRGVGRALMAALESAASALEFSELRLATGFRQPEAIALYESSGWQPRLTDWDGSPLPSYVHLFTKALT